MPDLGMTKKAVVTEIMGRRSKQDNVLPGMPYKTGTWIPGKMARAQFYR